MSSGFVFMYSLGFFQLPHYTPPVCIPSFYLTPRLRPAFCCWKENDSKMLAHILFNLWERFWHMSPEWDHWVLEYWSMCFWLWWSRTRVLSEMGRPYRNPCQQRVPLLHLSNLQAKLGTPQFSKVSCLVRVSSLHLCLSDLQLNFFLCLLAPWIF